MGSGNTKVKKISQLPSLSERKDSREEANKCLSNAAISSHSSKSTINSEVQEAKEWTPPGMAMEKEGTSLITSEALILGKKKLKATSQSNNNCNASIDVGQNCFCFYLYFPFCFACSFRSILRFRILMITLKLNLSLQHVYRGKTSGFCSKCSSVGPMQTTN